MLTRQTALTAALLSAAFVLTACSVGTAEPVADPTSIATDSGCVAMCQASDEYAPTASESTSGFPGEGTALPDEENSDVGDGYQQPAPLPPVPSRPEPTPVAPVCPLAVAGWTAGDLALTEIPGNVNKNLGIGTEYRVSATISVSNQSDAPLTINYLTLSTEVATSRVTFAPSMELHDVTVQAGEIKSFPVRSILTVGMTDGDTISSSSIDKLQRQASYDLSGTFDASCRTWGFPLNYVPSN
ncbi:hypothetical protein [Microbacterium sp.]|uniref:hypothetical protein n=1 Tax=Microbacterium sp. TaxID=51671 RepID=UPI003C710BD5